LNVIFYSLYGELASNRFPVCHQPFIIIPALNHPPTGNGGNDTSGI